MSMTDEELMDAAIANIDFSYAPYSKFHVSAAILTIDDEVFVGVNIENVSYGLSMCAERVAIGNAIANGANDIVAIAIFHDGDEMPYPCGACLQVLSEFNENMRVIISCYSDVKKYSLSELLPHKFTSEEV